LRSIHTTFEKGNQEKIVFVQNRNKKSDWLAIPSTNCTLSKQDIIQIYGICWDIEIFLKMTKSLLRIQKEFQGVSYDLLITSYNYWMVPGTHFFLSFNDANL
jgi:hypothetical protein